MENNFWADSHVGTLDFVDPNNPNVITDISSPSFATCSGFELKSSSTLIDAGTDLCTVSGINNSVITFDRDAGKYFRVSDEIWINGESAIISTIDAQDVTVDDMPENPEVGLGINDVKIYTSPDIGVYEYSSNPWGFEDPEYPDYYAVHGTAKINNVPLERGDWVGAFDADGNCYGAGQYDWDQAAQMDKFHLSIIPKEAPGGGFDISEKVYFKFYVVATAQTVDATPIPVRDILYPDVVANNPGPEEINLVKMDTWSMELDVGWNFVSIDIQPVDGRPSEVFKDIASTEYSPYVTNHMHWWQWNADTAFGSLQEIKAESYHIHVESACTLTIRGLRLAPPYSVSLKQGWNSIAYPYDSEKQAFGFDGTTNYTGIFRNIISAAAAENFVLWVKSIGMKWATPYVDDLDLGRGKGIFIKVKADCTQEFTEDDQ